MSRTSGASLFQRIQASSAGVVRPRMMLGRAEYLNQLMDSVRVHLEQLLNTRAGASQSCSSYGLYDFNDAAVGSSDQARSIAQDIKRCISEYETRLCDVDVQFSGYKEEDPTVLLFGIHCGFNIESKHERVSLELYLDRDRKFKVR